MNPEDRFREPALEQALSEIRGEPADPALAEAAAARVWARMAEAIAETPAHLIRSCADFQSLIPEFRVGRLTEARALLLEDHLHQCVACRRIYEGKAAVLPWRAPSLPAARPRRTLRWMAAAAAVAAAAFGIQLYTRSTGIHWEPASVQAVSGRLFLVTPAGFQPLAAAQKLPDGVEVRTGQDSDAVLKLQDGSLVELRERSGLSASHAGDDLTVRLARGSVIVEAAKRRAGHLYVETADYRVGVTGTIFGVSEGAKGSRVAVLEGQVRVAQGTSERLLKPGEQATSGDGMEPQPLRAEIAWSRNRERYYALPGLRAALESVHLPELRYTSRLLDRLPENTALYVSIPNLADYLGEVQSVFGEQAAQDPAFGEWWGQHGARVRAVLDKLRAASAYLGDEIVLAAFPGGHGPALMAEVKRDGFAQFLAAQGLQLTVESRNGLVVFGPDREGVAQLAPAMDQVRGGFAATPFRARIARAYSQGAGLLLCVDLSRMGSHDAPAGAHYFIAEQKEIDHQMEARATLAFEGPRSGPVDWLAAPGPLGSLDYISPEASAMGAFVARHPAAIIDQLTGAGKAPAGVEPGSAEISHDLEAALGGEFALAVDGPLLPVPSWKLIVEAYDPARVQDAIERLAAKYNRLPAAAVKSLTVSRDAPQGGTAFYTIVGTPKNSLTEAHYTFSGGYMIAAPTRALVERALQTRESGTSILRSSKFRSLTPRDAYANFSGVMYQNFGRSLAPLAGLFGHSAEQGLTDLKPMLIAVYGEADGITAASNGNLLGMSLGKLLTGKPGDWAAGVIPFGQFTGTHQGQPAYREK